MVITIRMNVSKAGNNVIFVQFIDLNLQFIWQIPTSVSTFSFGTDFHYRQLVLAGKAKKAQRYMYGMMEQSYKVARDVGPNVTQYIVIVSLANFNRREHLCLACKYVYRKISSLLY